MGVAPTAGVPSVAARVALSAQGATWIDLRAPVEFAEDHVPEALNVPLFDDVQRALVGVLYRQESPDAAFEAGLRLVHENVGRIVRCIGEAVQWEPPRRDLDAAIDELCAGGIAALDERVAPWPAVLPERAVVLYCWRGGLRSRSLAALLRLMGLERAVVIEGGFKSCRREVVEKLSQFRAPPTFVLRGLTGVGKTLVLRELERLRPGWTLDLEGLAQHRSSILGMVGLAPVTQKHFETRTAQRLACGFPGPLVVEGESRKVGDVIVPPALWRALDAGTNLELVAGIEQRIDVLLADYLEHSASRAELSQQLGFIEQRLGERWHGVLTGHLSSGRERELVAVLLEHYYDPRYRHSEQGRKFAARFDSGNPRACAEQIAVWLEANTESAFSS